jgi:NADP-dependent 3-hydroxy acid dehydrogenase YdfG
VKEFSRKVSVITGAGSGIGASWRARAPGWRCRASTATVCVGRLKRAGERALSMRRATSLTCPGREAVFAHADTVRARFGRVNLVMAPLG